MKKVVDLLITNADTMKQERSGRVIWDGETITFDGMSERFISSLTKDGIIGGKPPHPLYPRDGLAFLEALPREFSGSMIRASAVREIE